MKEAENLSKNILYLLKTTGKDVKFLINREGELFLAANTVYCLLKPSANPKLKTIEKVAKILNVSVEWLIQEHDFSKK
ncbi:hypothetical protein FAI40_08370 [Acetobacteraceae bacterium]|nr:hypothetical protein FAI40_08370 [Acetobacteraceae bacterium]